MRLRSNPGSRLLGLNVAHKICQILTSFACFFIKVTKYNFLKKKECCCELFCFVNTISGSPLTLQPIDVYLFEIQMKKFV